MSGARTLALMTLLTVACLTVIAVASVSDSDPVLVNCEQGVPPQYLDSDGRLSDAGFEAWEVARVEIYRRLIADRVRPSQIPRFEYGPRPKRLEGADYPSVDEALTRARDLIVGTVREQRFELRPYSKGPLEYPVVLTVLDTVDGTRTLETPLFLADTCGFQETGPLRIGNHPEDPIPEVGRRYAILADYLEATSGHSMALRSYTFLLDDKSALVPISREPEVEPLRGLPAGELIELFEEAQRENSN